MEFIDNPQKTVYLNLVRRRQTSEIAVAGQEDASRMGFRKCERKTVVDRKLWGASDHLLSTQHAVSG